MAARRRSQARESFVKSFHLLTRLCVFYSAFWKLHQCMAWCNSWMTSNWATCFLNSPSQTTLISLDCLFKVADGSVDAFALQIISDGVSGSSTIHLSYLNQMLFIYLNPSNSKRFWRASLAVNSTLAICCLSIRCDSLHSIRPWAIPSF